MLETTRDSAARATKTANKFSQDVGRSFRAAAAPFCYEEDAFVPASDKTGAMLRTDNGVRAWRFKRHSNSARTSARTSGFISFTPAAASVNKCPWPARPQASL